MTQLGRTGLVVSTAGLGCGGASKLGQASGASEQASISVVERALELGINYVDTAEGYGTEEIVGKAIAGKRDRVVVSTKSHVDAPDGGPLAAAGLRAGLHRSLERLRCDWVDVYHLHAVGDDRYDHCVAELVPELERLRDQGLIRFIAISERFRSDPGHRMLQRALAEDFWDVMMVGFNPLNPSARRLVLPAAIAKGIGIEVMCAVRRALSDPEELRRVVRALADESLIDGEIDLDDPLGFLVEPGGADSVVDAAYRFSRHEPGCHVVLTGTGDIAHLEQNVRSLTSGPLPASALERLTNLFGHLDHLSGN
jgi:L-galactose dehydrogenase